VINTPINVDVLANDILPQGANVTVSVIGSVNNATVVVNADNTVTVTPATDFEGNVKFDYIVCGNVGTFQFCDTASVCVTVVDTTVECYIPNGFSPNNDGVNDVFEIPCNTNYPEAKLRIFNRWGVEVWRSDGPYQNNWTGVNFDNTKLPDGTYYIIYEYNDGVKKSEAKFVVIQR
jgi:gliding motility-associated-like protein